MDALELYQDWDITYLDNKIKIRCISKVPYGYCNHIIEEEKEDQALLKALEHLDEHEQENY